MAKILKAKRFLQGDLDFMSEEEFESMSEGEETKVEEKERFIIDPLAGAEMITVQKNNISNLAAMLSKPKT
jgi:hypothetical protein